MATNALTLTDVVVQLQTNNNTVEKTNRHLEDFFKQIERSRLDQLEALREMKKGGGGKEGSPIRTTEKKEGGFDWKLLAGLMPFLAGLTAFGLAMGGLRGWEVGAIKKVATALKTFTTSLVEGAKAIGISILQKLGIYKVQARDPLGRFAKGQQWNIVQKLQQTIRGWVKSFNAFIQPVKDFFQKEGIIRKTFRFIGKVLTWLGGYFSETIDMAKEFGGKIKAFFAPVTKFFTNMFSGGGTGKVTEMVEKVSPYLKKFGKYVMGFLKPIGVIFSFFEGFKAFRDKEGDLFDKIGAGVGAFLGDFFGGLGTMLTGGIGWLLKKFGGDKAGEYFSNIDVGQLIKDMVENIFGIVKKLFTGDFSGAFGQFFSMILGENSPINVLLLKPLSMAIDWLLKKFGWKDEDAPPFDIWKTISGWIDGVLNWLDVTWRTVKIFFKQMPDRISLYFEEAWLGMMTDLKKGWEKLSSWITNLPNSIMIGALTYIKENFPKTFSFLGGNDMLGKVQSASDSNQMASEKRMAAIDTESSDKRRALDARRQALDDERAKATAPAPVAAGGGASGGSTSVNAPTQVVTPPPKPKDQSDSRNY